MKSSTLGDNGAGVLNGVLNTHAVKDDATRVSVPGDAEPATLPVARWEKYRTEDGCRP